MHASKIDFQAILPRKSLNSLDITIDYPTIDVYASM